MEVMPLKAMYPQGGEKVLIYHVTGEKVPEGKLPLDVGAVVHQLYDDRRPSPSILQNRACRSSKSA